MDFFNTVLDFAGTILAWIIAIFLYAGFIGYVVKAVIGELKNK